MSKTKRALKIKLIPISKINILNPRVRNQNIFYDIANNMTQVGLKRPITVMPCQSGAQDKEYDLVCGQGRLEAFMSCGQTEIPAIIIEANEEEALIMSLVENLARRKHNPIDLLQGIELLRKQKYDTKTICTKTGMSSEYINSIIKLMDHGEERLLVAVETGQMPLSLAVRVVTSPDDEQRALQETYESKQLRGKKLLFAKKLIESRRREGKLFRKRLGGRGGGDGSIVAKDILKVYQKEVDRKRLFTRKAEIVSSNLTFVVEALRRLFKEDHFITLLRAENMLSMPAVLRAMLDAKVVS
jgi:ParB family chromosome partitioning protein